MVLIQFANVETERRALGYLAGRFSIKTWANGETLVPAEALAHLAAEQFEFTVKGRPGYEREFTPLRDPAAATV